MSALPKEGDQQDDPPSPKPKHKCKTTHHRPLRGRWSVYYSKMLNLVRELCLLSLAIMIYTAITNDAPKATKAPAAYPFFPKHSIVKDYYRGQITEAIEYAKTSDLSFLMFYAPWDAASQIARKEFLNVAYYLKDYISFTAVNCWQPGSECRTQYGKVYRWPVLIAYPSYGTGIQYKGPISAPHIIKFLMNIMKPIQRISKGNILDFQEGFIVAELNTLPKSPEYSVYYLAAMKYLEGDPTGRIGFYVKPTKHTINRLTMYLWNDAKTLEIESGRWKVEKILAWIKSSETVASTWVLPSGSKSLVLSDHLQPGPALVLFTPKNPLHPTSDYYMMLQEVAFEYNSCHSNDKFDLMFDMKSKREYNLAEFRRLKKLCRKPQNEAKYLNKIVGSITTTTPFLNLTTIKSDYLGFNCDASCPSNSGSFTRFRYPTSDWNHRRDSDPKSMDNLKKLLTADECRLFVFAESLQPAFFVSEPQHNDTLLRFPGCEGNRSLVFLAMDSLKHSLFAERLGIDLDTKSDRSAVVIFDEEMEAHYLMEPAITLNNLREFIQGYLQNNLERSLKSIRDLNKHDGLSYPVMQKFNDSSKIYLEELKSDTFLPTVLQDNKIVVVLFYSKQCSFCAGVSYVFLSVARQLGYVNTIDFKRIDGDINLLPWEYTMEDFPTILFFPSRHKEETKVFPSHLPISMQNLLGFIIANVESHLRLHMMYSVCQHSQLLKHKIDCLSSLRYETQTVIEHTLRLWRKSNQRHRRLLVHNLIQLKELQLLFHTNPDDFLAISKCIKKIKTHDLDDYRVIPNEPTTTLRDEL